MKLLNEEIRFEIETGIVVIVNKPNGYFFEWISGEGNGMHNCEPFKTFDAVYRDIRRINGNLVKERQYIK